MLRAQVLFHGLPMKIAKHVRPRIRIINSLSLKLDQPPANNLPTGRARTKIVGHFCKARWKNEIFCDIFQIFTFKSDLDYRFFLKLGSNMLSAPREIPGSEKHGDVLFEMWSENEKSLNPFFLEQNSLKEVQTHFQSNALAGMFDQNRGFSLLDCKVDKVGLSKWKETSGEEQQNFSKRFCIFKGRLKILVIQIKLMALRQGMAQFCNFPSIIEILPSSDKIYRKQEPSSPFILLNLPLQFF